MVPVRVQGKNGGDQETNDLTSHCQQIADEFAVLQDHFEMMMKLSDVGFLAEAMVNHQEMMTKYADNLARHQEMCRMMVGVTTGSSTSGARHSSHGH